MSVLLKVCAKNAVTKKNATSSLYGGLCFKQFANLWIYRGLKIFLFYNNVEEQAKSVPGKVVFATSENQPINPTKLSKL